MPRRPRIAGGTQADAPFADKHDDDFAPRGDLGTRKDPVTGTVTIANGVLIHRSVTPDRADATVTPKHAGLVAAPAGATTLHAKVAAEEVRIEGDRGVLARLAGWFDRPNPSFAIVTL